MFLERPPMAISVADIGDRLTADIAVASAKAMVSRGLCDAGYKYLIIGDSWCAGRGCDGVLMCDGDRFPGGLKALSDELSSMGIGLGIVTSAGTRTKSGRCGSFDREYDDAEYFARNGVRYVAHDVVNSPEKIDRFTLIRRMGLALRAADNGIIYSVYGGNDTFYKYIRSSGACLYREGLFGDCGVDFPDDILAGYSAISCFYNCGKIKADGVNPVSEVKRAIMICSALSSPVTVECDPALLSDGEVDALTDKTALFALLDEEGRPARRMNTGDARVYTKFLDDNKYAIYFFNDTAEKKDLTLYASDFGLNRDAAMILEGDGEVLDDSLTVTLGGRECRMFIMSPKEVR